jgi:hypothetical protein
VLRDTRSDARPFLDALDTVHARGPEKMSARDRALHRAWILKMLERARRGRADPHDLEAHYRGHWLLKDLLELAFTLRDRWYEGPKRALATLSHSDPSLHALFDAALAPHAEFSALEALVRAIHAGQSDHFCSSGS